MTKIIVGKTYSQIKEEDDINFLQKLDKHLSYKIPGAEYTTAFQKGFFNSKTKQWSYWDGINKLLTKKLQFPTGLLKRVEDFYHNNGKDFILDKSWYPGKNQPMDISKKLNKLNKIPRDYQLDIVKATQENDRGIIRACTGSGKTLCAALITADKNTNTIIYVIGKDLLYQFYNLFVDIFGSKLVGIIGDGKCDIKKINIASIWTLGHYLNINDIEQYDEEDEENLLNGKAELIKSMVSETKLHIFDECHMITCDTMKAIYNNSMPDFIYGMSGTPFRDDESDLMAEALLGQIIVDVPASTLIERGILAKPFIKFIDVPEIDKPGANYQSVYKNYVVENMDRNRIILSKAKDLINKGYQVLVLFTQIKHGNILFDMFRGAGINCEILSGKDKTEVREDVKQKIANKQIDCILASRIYDIGADHPTISALILAGPSKSSIRALQRIGRVIRKHPGKNVCAVVDFNDNVKFLKNHSKKRFKIYSSEPGFDVKM